MEHQMKPQIEQLVDYIMKKCLWQFHSRTWDRERQNANILGMTTQLLCQEPVDLSTPADRCYWVDAVCLADAFRARYPWLTAMGVADIKQLMQGLHERLNVLTITGSLNKELTDQRY
jgi:Fe-only nitrogenase delta subunit